MYIYTVLPFASHTHVLTSGREVGKPYLDKARSLLFNLNSNPDLRRAVYTVCIVVVKWCWWWC